MTRQHRQTVRCPADDGAVLSALDGNAEEEMAAEDIADVTVLRARVKHLEMQQSLMDREVESMSDLARQSETQLRCAPWWFDISKFKACCVPPVCRPWLAALHAL